MHTCTQNEQAWGLHVLQECNNSWHAPCMCASNVHTLCAYVGTLCAEIAQDPPTPPPGGVLYKFPYLDSFFLCFPSLTSYRETVGMSIEIDP